MNELIELAERWANPFRLRTLAGENKERSRLRVSIEETTATLLKLEGYTPPRPMRDDAAMLPRDNLKTQNRKYAILRNVQANPVLVNMRQEAERIEARTAEAADELTRLEALTREHAPDLLGYLPVILDPQNPKIEEHARMLLGYLLARRQQPNTPVTPKSKASKLALAMGMLYDHPDWASKSIAEEVGCTEEYLSRSQKFQAAREAIRVMGKAEMRRGERHRGNDMDEYE